MHAFDRRTDREKDDSKIVRCIRSRAVINVSRYKIHDTTLTAALHEMQTRYSDEKAVRPSVCQRVDVTKRKKDRSRFLYDTKDH